MKVALWLAAVLLALAGGYWLGTRSSTTPGAPVEPPSTAVAATSSRPLPAGHPPLADAPTDPSSVTGSEAELLTDTVGKFTHFRVGERNVKRIFADGDVMWIGTSGGAVRYELATDTYRLFDLRDGLLAKGIFHVGKLRGRVVLGTYGGGMALYDAAGDRWQIYNVPEGLGDAFVYDVLEARNGDVWVATWSGVNRVRGGDLDSRDAWALYTVENTANALPNDWVYGLAEGRNGDIWLATEGGLARYRDERFEHWNHPAGLGADYEAVKDALQFRNDPARFSAHHSRQKVEMGLQNVDVAFNPNYVVALLVDRAGIVWAGTWGGGLARFDGKSFRNFTTDDGLPGNHVFALAEDAAGRLWVGTSAGLARRTDDGFRVYTVNEGLYSNIVFSLASAPDGSLWVGSFGGVARLTGLD